MKVRIKSFNGELPEYLTEGKEYPCGRYGEDSICARFDDGEPEIFNLENCNHLNGGSWEIVNENQIRLVGCAK